MVLLIRPDDLTAVRRVLREPKRYMEDREGRFEWLRLEEKCSGFSKVWELRWDYADALFLSKTVYGGGRSEWVGEVAVITVLPEAPWMFRYTELEAKVGKLGVRETVRAILGLSLIHI